ncbi:MAG: tRNA (N6-isopentenyl adenosine(37)-C2)-methylthiotransferase MiaB [Desulfobacterales bacterium]|nr:tRNA (N6-isopentenyl adenosine(37)-C2)-methylthiotransferase MiaB [Desulfobacterales bacterium]
MIEYGQKVHINTIGCQMNVYDSGQMMAILNARGFEETGAPEAADVIIVNTCAIREKAVQKMASFIGRFSGLKSRNPGARIVVAGCVAQQLGRKIIERFPYVDIVVGTHAFPRLPAMLEQVSAGGGPLVETEMTESLEKTDTEMLLAHHQTDISEFVTIMRGCDNYCTYCVVPYVRGPEINRHPDDIVSEIRALVKSGMKEVTLLGQNVNSYGKKEGLCAFPELLEKVNAISGLRRIRFVTSHPKDLSDELIAAFARLEKLCRHIHLPVQSGSDRILKKMNRKYTADEYLDKVRRLRAAAPDMAVTTDIIAGFPGETEQDFKQTLDLIEQVEYDSLFAFEYSDRPDAPARHFKHKVAPDEKNRRLRELFALQETISRKKQQAMVGKTVEVLIEGESKRQQKLTDKDAQAPLELTGRTSGNRIVNFYRNTDCSLDIRDLKGQIISIKIEKAFSNSLWGIPAETASAEPQTKGGYVYVA